MNQIFIIVIGIITFIFAFLIVIVIGMYGENKKYSFLSNTFFENFDSSFGYLDYSSAKLTMDISKSNIPYYKTISYEILPNYNLNSPNILPLTKYDTSYNSYYYDTNNYDVQYHSVYNNKLESTGIWVKNAGGKLEYIEWSEVPKYSTYYQPNTLKYGPSNYVPSYEDTVYLRKHTNKKDVIYER